MKLRRPQRARQRLSGPPRCPAGWVVARGLRGSHPGPPPRADAWWTRKREPGEETQAKGGGGGVAASPRLLAGSRRGGPGGGRREGVRPGTAGTAPAGLGCEMVPRGDEDPVRRTGRWDTPPRSTGPLGAAGGGSGWRGSGGGDPGGRAGSGCWRLGLGVCVAVGEGAALHLEGSRCETGGGRAPGSLSILWRRRSHRERGGPAGPAPLGPRCSAPGGRLGGGTSCLPSGQQGGPYQPCFLEKALIVTVILVTATPVQCFSWAGPWSEVCTDRLVQASQPRGLDWAGEATWAQRGAA